MHFRFAMGQFIYGCPKAGGKIFPSNDSLRHCKKFRAFHEKYPGFRDEEKPCGQCEMLFAFSEYQKIFNAAHGNEGMN